MSGRDQDGRTRSSTIALLGVGALLLFALGTHSCIFGGFGYDVLGSRRWSFGSLLGLGLGLGGLLQIGLALWVGYDAHRRGLNGFLWGLLVLFTFIVGLVVYLIVGPSMSRQDGGPFQGDWGGRVTPSAATAPTTGVVGSTTGAGRTPAACPHCNASVQADFKVCPYCAGTLCCASCNGALERDWKVCPRCGTAVPAQTRLS